MTSVNSHGSEGKKPKMIIHTVAEYNFTTYKDYIKYIDPLSSIKLNIRLIIYFFKVFLFTDANVPSKLM